MMPYSRINIGDIFESPGGHAGVRISFEVVDKCDGLVEVYPSYQHPALPDTLWKKPSDRIFTKRLTEGGSHER